MVVLLATKPSMPRPVAMRVVSKVTSSDESGDSLRRIGFESCFLSRISNQERNTPSSKSSSWRSLKPGVFGDDMFKTKKSA